MNAFVSTQGASVNPYRDIYEQYANDASFLWLLRAIATEQPHYTQDDINELERRIDAQLDGLMTAPEDAWEICSEALAIAQPGEAFAAAVLAFRSLDVTKIQHIVQQGLSSDDMLPGLVSALGWLPGRFCHSWIKKFLTSKDINHKYLAIATCSIRREDPLEYLSNIFQREDCLEHKKLYARALRLVGELKRRDLSPAVRIAMRAEEPEIFFWAHWSAILLGDRMVATSLQPLALKSGPLQAKAVQLAFRVLPVEEARTWIGLLAKDPTQVRTVIKATAALGDPHAVTWLINQMRNPALTRLAGEAFTTITGIDLLENNLALDDLPDLDAQFPNEDVSDDNVDLDEDEHLPFPDTAKISAIWQKYQQRFISGQRYLLGKVISEQDLKQIFMNSQQRHRQAAAMELALLEPNTLLLNHQQRGQGPL